jgi:hypothetical protein
MAQMVRTHDNFTTEEQRRIGQSAAAFLASL